MLTRTARRTSTYDVITAWQALLDAKDPKEIMNNQRLKLARQEINEEVERKTHTPPKFSKDGKVAVLNISSQAQVHPVIATRWVSLSHFINYNHKVGTVLTINSIRRVISKQKISKLLWWLITDTSLVRSTSHVVLLAALEEEILQSTVTILSLCPPSSTPVLSSREHV